MELNWLVFPAPFPPSYISSTELMPKVKLVYIPEDSKETVKDEEIKDLEAPMKSPFATKVVYTKRKGFPWWYIPHPSGSSKIIMYFHGNAEDMGHATIMMDKLSSELECHVICVEYPGYGICYQEKPNAEVIKRRAKRAYDFLTKEFLYDEKEIIIFGRSVGSGPAVELASITEPAALILMSAYTSLKNVAKDFSKWIGCLVKERFNSIRKIRDIDCPILLIHGEADDVIKVDHSKRLSEEAKEFKKNWDLEIRPNMDHNDFDYSIDIVGPIKTFLNKNRISVKSSGRMTEELDKCLLEDFRKIYKTPEVYDKEKLYEGQTKSKAGWCCCTIF